MLIPMEKIRDLKPRTPFLLLSQLAELAKKVRDGSLKLEHLPIVKIELGTQFRYEGIVWDFNGSGRENYLLLLQNTKSATFDLSYLQVFDPIQITFPFNESLIPFLQSGSMGASWSTDRDLTSLQLKRALATTVEDIKKFAVRLDVSNDLIKENGKENVIIRDLAMGIQEYLVKTTSDSLGKEALATLKTIKLSYSAGVALQIAKEGDTLAMVFDPKINLPEKGQFFAMIDELITNTKR